MVLFIVVILHIIERIVFLIVIINVWSVSLPMFNMITIKKTIIIINENGVGFRGQVCTRSICVCITPNRHVYRSTYMYTYIHVAFEAKFVRDIYMYI